MSGSDNFNSVFPLRTEKSTFQHLQPLSIYSHMVCREQYNPSSPLCNIQVQIPNRTSSRYKRRLDDSCLDETCETPLKKACLYKSCSPDQGCVVDSLDFSPGVQGSTAMLTISKDVTPPRPKVIQPVTPVMSTPVSQNRSVQAREGLPSPIPVLNWDRDTHKISLHTSLSVDLCNSFCVSLTGKGEVREVSHVPVEELKSCAVPSETVETEAVVEEKGVSENLLTESKLETEESFENSLPLQVQVKSKVVIPETTKTLCRLTATQSERKPECDIYRRARFPVQRPVVFYNEENWHRAKKTYVESVMRHMETNGSEGVMTELHHLMNTVAGQCHSRPSGRDGGQWQHPSDLTQRNYRVMGPLLSLSEWQKRNHLDLRRFTKVPDIFHRSPVL